MCPNCKAKEYGVEGQQSVPRELWDKLGKTITLVTCLNCGSTTNLKNWG